MKIDGILDIKSRTNNTLKMASNLHLDNQMLARAQKFGGFQSKKETINHALSEFVRRHEQRHIADLFGTIDFSPGFNHKKLRAKR